MTTLTEEARWARLRAALEDRFGAWGVQAPEIRAAEIVQDLRRSGYRVPLPASALPPRGWNVPSKKLDPARVNEHLAKCRAALRGDDTE